MDGSVSMQLLQSMLFSKDVVPGADNVEEGGVTWGGVEQCRLVGFFESEDGIIIKLVSHENQSRCPFYPFLYYL
jgi:hypothetical protein